MLTKALTLALLALGAVASPINNEPEALEKRACPGVHVFGARETTAGAGMSSPMTTSKYPRLTNTTIGYGSAGPVVTSIVNAHSGATSEAIVYPACGGQASCGGVAYASSVSQGTTAVVNAVSAFAKQCPSTELVLVGYSQVSHLF